MYSNQDAINMFNQMTAMGFYYDSGRPVLVDPNIIMEDIVSKIPLKADDVILDVGCGTGVVTIPLAKRCSFVHALDAGAKVLEVAKERCRKENVSNISYYQGRALELPFKRDFFDHVLMYAVIHYLESEEQVKQCVAEMARVCKPGGRILIAEIPDKRVRMEFDQKVKSSQEERLIEQYNANRTEYDRLLKEHVQTHLSASSLVLDCQRIVEEGVRLGLTGQVCRQDIRQPFSLTRRDVLLIKHPG